jgi:hypothetical protein
MKENLEKTADYLKKEAQEQFGHMSQKQIAEHMQQSAIENFHHEFSGMSLNFENMILRNTLFGGIPWKSVMCSYLAVNGDSKSEVEKFANLHIEFGDIIAIDCSFYVHLK